MERIEAELLIPGWGEPVSDGVVIIDDTAISYAGPASAAPATPGAVVHRTETVMPGLWDCHGHFLGMLTLDLGRLPLDPVPLRAARCARDAHHRGLEKRPSRGQLAGPTLPVS